MYFNIHATYIYIYIHTSIHAYKYIYLYINSIDGLLTNMKKLNLIPNTILLFPRSSKSALKTT